MLLFYYTIALNDTTGYPFLYHAAPQAATPDPSFIRTTEPIDSRTNSFQRSSSRRDGKRIENLPHSYPMAFGRPSNLFQSTPVEEIWRQQQLHLKLNVQERKQSPTASLCVLPQTSNATGTCHCRTFFDRFSFAIGSPATSNLELSPTLN